MWAVAAIIAGIIGLAAISHSLLRHYLTSNKSETHKPQSQDKNPNKARCTEQEVMMTNSDGFDVLDNMWAAAAITIGMIGLAAISLSLLRHYLTSSKSQRHNPQSQDKNQNKAGCTEQEAMMTDSDDIDVLNDLYTFPKDSDDIDEMKIEFIFQSYTSNSDAFDASAWSIRILGDVMEALADPNTHLIGVYGSNDEIKDALLQKVYRRVQRDQLFGIVVTAAVTKYPNLRKIQKDISRQLKFTFNQKSKAKRAEELIYRIKNEQNILIVLRDLYKGLDLNKVGIPYGANHSGLKILLTSTTEDVLSNHMRTQKNIMVI